MHAGDIVDRLPHAHPARQDGDIGDETDVAHQLIARPPWILAEDGQLPS